MLVRALAMLDVVGYCTRNGGLMYTPSHTGYQYMSQYIVQHRVLFLVRMATVLRSVISSAQSQQFYRIFGVDR